MNKIKLLLGASILLLVSVQVNASMIWDYSYSFLNGTTVSGSFMGDRNGHFVENISDIKLFVEGVEYTNIRAVGCGEYFGEYECRNPSDFPLFPELKVYFDGSLNEFMFTDMGDIIDESKDIDWTVIFQMVDPQEFEYFAGLGTRLEECRFDPDCESGPFFALDLQPNYDSWFLTVPEPSILALMGLGLVGLSFARRKRQLGSPVTT